MSVAQAMDFLTRSRCVAAKRPAVKTTSQSPQDALLAP
jgi:hypothetical protein